MDEYEVTFTVPETGQILFDVHKSGGKSQFLTFESAADARAFFCSLGLHEKKVAEIAAICDDLRPGETYHEKMFLPDLTIDCVMRQSQQPKAQGIGTLHPAL